VFVNIQWLRAFGAIAVLLYHLSLRYPAIGGTDSPWSRVTAFGFAGVDVFFVVSGFVMMHVIGGRPPSLDNVRDFLGRRLVRIYGWYLPCAAIAVLLIWACTPAVLERINFLRSATLTSVYEPELALGPSWTLSYELYFYFLIALAWVVAPRRLVAVLWVAAAALWALWLVMPYRLGTPLSFVASPLILEFIAGALLYAHRGLAAHRVSLMLCAAATVLFLLLAAHFNAATSFTRIWTFGAASLFLVALLVGLEGSRRCVAGRLSKALGDASYTIYLLHTPFITAIYFAGVSNALPRMETGAAAAGLGAAVIAFLAACIYLHYVVELPFYRWLCAGLRLAPKPRVRVVTSP
jgi:exopolysaccharide production protein ExoZ